MFAKPNGPNAWGGDFGLWGQRHFSQPRGWSFGDFLNCFTAVRCWYSGDTGMTEDRGKTYRIKKVLDQAVDLLAVPQTWYFYLPSLLWQLLFQDITHFSTSQFHPISQCQGDDSVASDPLSIETCGCTVVPGSLCVAQIWMPEPGPALEGHAIHSNGTMEPQNGSTDERTATLKCPKCAEWNHTRYWQRNSHLTIWVTLALFGDSDSIEFTVYEFMKFQISQLPLMLGCRMLLLAPPLRLHNTCDVPLELKLAASYEEFGRLLPSFTHSKELVDAVVLVYPGWQNMTNCDTVILYFLRGQ